MLIPASSNVNANVYDYATRICLRKLLTLPEEGICISRTSLNIFVYDIANRHDLDII